MLKKIELKQKFSKINRHVGKRIRAIRILSGLTQTEFSEVCGVITQQVQKYESGLNRISAAKLYHISVFFNVPIAFFYQGFQDIPEALCNNQDPATELPRKKQEARNIINDLQCAIKRI